MSRATALMYRWRFVALLVALWIVGASSMSAIAIAQEFPGVGKVKKLHGGFQFTEGPAYDREGKLYFTDIPNDRILRTDLKGNLETFLPNCGHCNGLIIDGAGRLIGCRMDGELIAIDTETKQVTVLSKEHDGKRFNACNDLVIDELGGVYFTDPRFMAPDPWPQKKEAVYYRSPESKVTRLEDELVAPNGIILSPDEKTLYVVPSLQKQVFAYSVESPGVLKDRRVLFELKQPSNKADSGGDGLSIDIEGNLYVTSDLGVQVISPGGQLLGIISFPEQPANCAFGGPENKTLFATCRTSLYAVDMPIAGHVFPGRVK